VSLDSLALPGCYDIESSWDLVNRVRKDLDEDGLDADVRPVPEIENLHQRQQVRPLDLLLALGKTTSALPGLAADGAAGMAGLTALTTASQWAILRYVWAFADHRPDLRLSELTDQVRSHQRTILSEHFGIAVAADVVEQLILRQPASVVDADAVMYDPALGIAMSELRSHKPDYFWYCHDGDRLSQVIVVEAKGTTSGYRRTIRQLARGVEQVLVPSALPDVPMRRIVVGAGFRGPRLRAYAVEVRDPDVSTRQEAVAVIRRREDPTFARSRRSAEEGLESFYVRESPVAVAQEVLVEDQVRLHAFVGQSVTRDTVRTAPESTRAIFGSLEPVYADHTTFRCQSIRVPVGQRTLHVRTGVAEELLISPEEASQGNLASRRDIYQRNRSRNAYRIFSADAADGRPLPALVSSDGCMLSIVLE
jgi:hypothetical protein